MFAALAFEHLAQIGVDLEQARVKVVAHSGGDGAELLEGVLDEPRSAGHHATLQSGSCRPDSRTKSISKFVENSDRCKLL